MKLQLSALLLCGLLAGCATANNHPAPTAADNAAARLAADRVTDQQAFAAARTAVLAQLKDPDSAKFGNFTRKKGEANGMFLDIVCGSVNSKNGFGGYAGPEVFLYSVDKKGSPVFDTGIFNGVDIGIKGMATDRCIKNPPA
jgi:hypothetical protein